MADLDDFFAKKDKKKKGKKGSKFAKANTDILAQNLIENDKKTEDDEKKAATLLATSEANRAGAAKDNPGTDEEWHDYEEERKDFTNLKVETLKVKSGSDNDEGDFDESTGIKKREKGVENIWMERNKTANDECINDESDTEKNINQNSEAKVDKKPKAYVPPNKRNQAAGGNEISAFQIRPLRARKVAPDMNENNFPTLSESAMTKVAKDVRQCEEKEFETARGGGNQQQRVSEAPKLITTNKFSALRN